MYIVAVSSTRYRGKEEKHAYPTEKRYFLLISTRLAEDF
jgi:hypothetical protein